MTTKQVFYECGICDCIHPWLWNGDCRDDDNRLSLDDVPFDAEVRSMDERVAADTELRCDNCGYAGAARKPDAYPGEDCPRCGGEIK